MGWGSKAIEIRAVENGQLDGVFMHKRTQKLRFLCERNDKVRGGGEGGAEGGGEGGGEGGRRVGRGRGRKGVRMGGGKGGRKRGRR